MCLPSEGEKTMRSDIGTDQSRDGDVSKPWTFLTNHARVLIVIARNPDARLRDISANIGITERATQRIVGELEEAGYLSHDKVGRRNRYQIRPETHLRHDLERAYRVESLLDAFLPNEPGRRRGEDGATGERIDR